MVPDLETFGQTTKRRQHNKEEEVELSTKS